MFTTCHLISLPSLLGIWMLDSFVSRAESSTTMKTKNQALYYRDLDKTKGHCYLMHSNTSKSNSFLCKRIENLIVI